MHRPNQDRVSAFLFSAGVLLALLASGCSEPAPPARTAPASTASSGQTAAASAAEPASTTAFEPFSVRVTLSPDAAREMARRHETLIVSASYFGWPAAGRKLPVDDVGQVPLGNARHELSAPGETRFTGKDFAAGKTGQLEGPPQVNINVFSGRHSSPDNLLDCGIFQDAIATAARAPVPLHCDLLETR